MLKIKIKIEHEFMTQHDQLCDKSCNTTCNDGLRGTPILNGNATYFSGWEMALRSLKFLALTIKDFETRLHGNKLSQVENKVRMKTERPL